MTITRRSFLAGLGSVSVGLLFRRRLDAVLESLEQDLVDEPVVAGQAPSAAEIVVVPQVAFRPDRIFVSRPECWVIEDIHIGRVSQLVGAVPAEVFGGHAIGGYVNLSSAAPNTEIRFRVRYVGEDPAGAVFQAAMIGSSTDGLHDRLVLPITSIDPIVA